MSLAMVCAAEHVLVRDTSEIGQIASVSINNRKEWRQQAPELTAIPFARSLISDLCFLKLNEDISVCGCDVSIQE